MMASGLCLVVLATPSVAQEASPTPTVGRPTPIPTATRTATPLATSTPTFGPPTATPTSFPAGTDLFLCSAGSNDGTECADHSDCPGGACVRAEPICNSDVNDVQFCETDADCTNSRCTFTQKICVAGDNTGLPCLRSGQCPLGRCASTGLFCEEGGAFEFTSCSNIDDCTPETGTSSICRSPDVFLCSAGTADGATCVDQPDCPDGACVLAQKICAGGEVDGQSVDGTDCDTNSDCGGAKCTPTQHVCGEGPNQGFACLVDAHCENTPCVSTGLFCDGGGFFDSPYACTVNADCTAPSTTPGLCETPARQQLLCSAGDRDALDCQMSSECPSGVCVHTQGVCDGATNKAGDNCNSAADCPGATCQQAYTVCNGGDFDGYSCLRDDQCTGTPAGQCIASGQVCEGGPFDGFSCVVDEHCYNADSPTGACVGIVARACPLESPCELQDFAFEQVFAGPDGPDSPASYDFYTSAIPQGAVGMVAVMVVENGDADLFVGTSASTNLGSYTFRSENTGDACEEIRIDAFSQPSFASFTSSLPMEMNEVAIAVAGFDSAPLYLLQALYLGPSGLGDANCDSSINEDDLSGLFDVIFDPTADLTPDVPFARCVGADANADGRETAADLVATVRLIGAST